MTNPNGPNFDPTQLLSWDNYLKENPNVKIGDTMAVEFTAGLSGGRRKMLLFEHLPAPT